MEMPALPSTGTSRSLEARDDPKPDSSLVTLEIKDSRHFWESVTKKTPEPLSF
jgi:hypothetical protein